MDELRELIIWLLRQGRECEWIEYKENFHSAEEIGKSISALANGACLHQQSKGYLVFGVTDDLLPTGTHFDPHRTKNGNDPIENWIIQRLSPRIDYRIICGEVDGKKLVVFEIPAARDQPVCFINIAYIRVGNITRSLREFPDKERKIWNSRPDSAFVSEIAADRLHAQDVIDRLDLQSFFELIKMQYPSHRDEVINKLIDEDIVTRQQNTYAITNLGAILFAKRLDSFATVSRKAARVIVYEGKDKLKPVRDLTGRRGYASGFSDMINYIYNQLPANEEITKVIRETVNMFPKEMIREILANALIHQDFSEYGQGPLIEIYTDRMEVNNPGTPLIQPLRFLDGYKSRNEKLATLMRRLGICEERGSGVDRVVALAEVYQLPAPDFRVMEAQTQVVLFGHGMFSEMDKQDKIRACYQHCTLRYIRNEQMTNQSLRERFKINDQNAAVASRIIGDTLDAELIKPEDPENRSRKFPKYVPWWA